MENGLFKICAVNDRARTRSFKFQTKLHSKDCRYAIPISSPGVVKTLDFHLLKTTDIDHLAIRC